MLKLIGTLILAANVAANASIPLPTQSQPSPNQGGMQPAPESKTQSPDTTSAANPNPQAEPFHASRYSGKNHQRDPAKKSGTNDSKPHHDLFDYIGLLLPFLVGVATVAVLIIQSILLAKTMRATEGNTTATRRNALAAFASARAAKKSADVAERTLTDLETPFLYPVIVSSTIKDDLAAIKRYWAPDAPSVDTISRVTFRIKNYGRTPALLRSVAANLVHWTEMVAEPRTDIFADYAVEPVLEVGKETSHEFIKHMTVPIGPEEFKLIKESQSRIFLYGEAKFADIFGDDYTQTFCLAWDYTTRGFIPWFSRYNKRARNPTPN